MSRVTCDMAMSVDGFVAGPNQSLENPFGEGVEGRLHQWMFDEPDANAAEIEAMTAAGAFIMGRNMFSPAEAPGTWSGRDGGATSRRTTPRCSCSRIIGARR
jgi:dihydrofolate reductase